VYSRNEIPLLFNPEGAKPNTTLFPSCYFLFQQLALAEQDDVLKIYLRPGVEGFIFNGADLMWPGVFAMNRDDFKQNELVQIYSRYNGAKLA
jgi:predicted ribosome-associated RNA-binding protein Tma20